MNMSLARFGPAAMQRGYNTYDEAMAYQKKKGPRDIFKMAVMPAAMFATGGLGSAALMGGGGAANAAAGSGFVRDAVGQVASQVGGFGGGGAAPVLGIGSGVSRGLSLGGFLNSPMTGLGVNALTSWMGQRSANKAAKEAGQLQLTALERQLAADAANRGEQTRQFDASQADARAANQASNDLRRQELVAMEEERAFNRRLIEEQEARRNARRMRIADFLGMGR